MAGSTANSAWNIVHGTPSTNSAFKNAKVDPCYRSTSRAQGRLSIYSNVGVAYASLTRALLVEDEKDTKPLERRRCEFAAIDSHIPGSITLRSMTGVATFRRKFNF